MITEIPTPQEFAKASLDLLHLAWTIAARILEELDVSDVALWDEDGSAADAYLTSAQPDLGNAVALVLQAQEMGLKGRIAQISPFLIIARDPRDWPKQCDSANVSFADFRSADAADLIRINDTVGASRIAPEFVALFNMVRRRRNVLVHSVSKSERVRPQEVIHYIFQTISHLHDQVHWPTERVRYLSSSPLSAAWSNDLSYGTVLTEMHLCIKAMNYTEVLRYIGFDKKAPAFFCPYCDAQKGEAYEFPKLAQLAGGLCTTTRLHCFFCRKSQVVIRRPCLDPSCTHRVLIPVEDRDGPFVCLECHEETDPDEAEVGEDDLSNPEQG